MPLFELTTMIRAPRERVFDLARSMDAHQHTTRGMETLAAVGVTSGFIGMGDEVTWEARHFGIRQQLTARVTALDRPKHFQDMMTSGAFKRMVHDHEFEEHPRVAPYCPESEGSHGRCRAPVSIVSFSLWPVIISPFL